jgi:hypothetical protein
VQVLAFEGRYARASHRHGTPVHADVNWQCDWITKRQPTFKPAGPFIVPAGHPRGQCRARPSSAVGRPYSRADGMVALRWNSRGAALHRAARAASLVALCRGASLYQPLACVAHRPLARSHSYYTVRSALVVAGCARGAAEPPRPSHPGVWAMRTLSRLRRRLCNPRRARRPRLPVVGSHSRTVRSVLVVASRVRPSVRDNESDTTCGEVDSRQAPRGVLGASADRARSHWKETSMSETVTISTSTRRGGRGGRGRHL